MSPPPRSKAHALEENGGLSTLMEHLLMSQSSSRLSWRRMFSLQGRTGVWTGRADSCSTGSPPPPSPPPPPSQPPSVSTVSPAPRLVAASAANLSTWSSFYLLQCLTDIHFVNSVGPLILSSVNAYVEMSWNAYMKWDEIKSPHFGFKWCFLCSGGLNMMI